MKKVIGIFVALALAGCATDGSISSPPSLATIIADVQNLTRLACSVVPTANAVAQIVAVGDPALATAAAIANVICTAVGPTPASLKRSSNLHRVPAPVEIDGVTVTFQ